MSERLLMRPGTIPPFPLGGNVEIGWQPSVRLREVKSRVATIATEATAAIDDALAEAQYNTLPSFNAEIDPDVMAVRTEARTEAEGIMEAHVQSLCDGEHGRVPLEADAGGTARKLVAIGRVFGKNSPEYKQGQRALERDSERRLAEASRMNGWELFDVTEMDFDDATGDFFSDGFSVGEMLRNGITPATNPACPEERPRRINEFVEGATDAVLIRKPYMQGRSTYTFTQCPQSLIDRYRSNPNKLVYSDYVPAIEKFMIRHKLFDPKNGKIYMQQMAVPGTHINNEVINLVLAEMDATDGRRTLDRTEVHGTQAVVNNNDIPDVVAMLRRLDRKASEYHGIPIYLGQPLQPGQKPDYEGIYTEAENRRRDQKDLTLRYASKLVELEESGLTREMVGVDADEFLRDELLKIAQKDPVKAAMMFNEETARGFQLANELEARGQIQAALDLRRRTEEDAPAAGGCGAGTCGLEKLDKKEKEAAKDLLDIQSDEKTAKDTERGCKSCGKKAVVYAWNNKGYKKGCMSCRKTETVVGAKQKAPSPVTATIRRPQDGKVVTITANRQSATYAEKKAA